MLIYSRMKEIGKDLVRLIIVILVLCAFVYLMDDSMGDKRDIYYGVVGGGVTAFLVFFVVKRIRNKKR